MRKKAGTGMRISTFWFCLKQGLVNICRNIWFSLASAAIISACIFLFCVFYSIITNVQYMVVTAESTMGITVFFDESLPEDEIHAIGEEIRKAQGPIIKDMKFTSAEGHGRALKRNTLGRTAIWRRAFLTIIL